MVMKGSRPEIDFAPFRNGLVQWNAVGLSSGRSDLLVTCLWTSSVIFKQLHSAELEIGVHHNHSARNWGSSQPLCLLCYRLKIM